MFGLASTTVSVYRGTTTNSAGDVEDDNSTPAASGIPASITRSRNPLAFTESSYTPRTINWYRIRLPRRTVVLDEDRLKDEKTGDFYIVDAAVRAPGVGPAPDLMVECKKIN